jgi:hypothetical protein
VVATIKHTLANRVIRLICFNQQKFVHYLHRRCRLTFCRVSIYILHFTFTFCIINISFDSIHCATHFTHYFLLWPHPPRNSLLALFAPRPLHPFFLKSRTVKTGRQVRGGTRPTPNPPTRVTHPRAVPLHPIFFDLDQPCTRLPALLAPPAPPIIFLLSQITHPHTFTRSTPL